MEVIAIATAFWNNSRVRPGTRLTVPDGTKGKWFVPAEAHKAKAAKGPQAPVALSQLGQKPPQTMNQVLSKPGDSDLA